MMKFSSRHFHSTTQAAVISFSFNTTTGLVFVILILIFLLFTQKDFVLADNMFYK